MKLLNDLKCVLVERKVSAWLRRRSEGPESERRAKLSFRRDAQDMLACFTHHKLSASPHVFTLLSRSQMVREVVALLSQQRNPHQHRTARGIHS
jgi:hypothetical protein